MEGDEGVVDGAGDVVDDVGVVVGEGDDDYVPHEDGVDDGVLDVHNVEHEDDVDDAVVVRVAFQIDVGDDAADVGVDGGVSVVAVVVASAELDELGPLQWVGQLHLVISSS